MSAAPLLLVPAAIVLAIVARRRDGIGPDLLHTWEGTDEFARENAGWRNR